jgi:hypothetical protein
MLLQRCLGRKKDDEHYHLLFRELLERFTKTLTKEKSKGKIALGKKFLALRATRQ